MQVSSKKAFTMIELIFVIVIIGILAAVAIPKLAATRDDAKMSAAVANLKICVNDAGAAYTGRNQMDINGSAGCTGAEAACWVITEEDNGTVLLVESNTTTDFVWCTDAIVEATRLGLEGNHTFGGSEVVR